MTPVLTNSLLGYKADLRDVQLNKSVLLLIPKIILAHTKPTIGQPFCIIILFPTIS